MARRTMGSQCLTGVISERCGPWGVDELRGAFLAAVLGRAPSEVSFAAARERRFDLLGDLVEQHIDVDALLDLVRAGTPAGLPVLPPGGEV